MTYLLKVKGELSITYSNWFRGEFLELKYSAIIMNAYGCLEFINKMNTSISLRNFFLNLKLWLLDVE